MTDRFTRANRSRIMASVRSKNTRTEIRVRQTVFGLGFRYRLHAANLPGKPDLAFPSLKKVILVHGCFWHHHSGCPRSRFPRTRREFWVPKLKGNVRRDRAIETKLRKLGWKVLIVWECQTRDLNRMSRILERFLRPGKNATTVKRDPRRLTRFLAR